MSTVTPVQPDRPAPNGNTPVVPKRVTMPPPPAKQVRVWLMGLLAMAICLPPLLIEMNRAEVTQRDEAAPLVAARDTLAAMNDGLTDAWLTPVISGQPRYDRPPLLTWASMLTATVFDVPADAGALRWMARLMALGAALITLGATYVAGYNVGGVRVGRVAVMITGTTLLFVRFARGGTPDVHHLAWVTLAVAAGLWGMRPMRPMNWLGRRVIGWLIAGVALAAAIMTRGPVALLYVVLPLAGAIAVTQTRRLGNAVGLLFALLLGVLMGAAWYLVVAERHPDAIDTWLNAWTDTGDSYHSAAYYLILIPLVFPWSACLVAALAQPYLRASGEHRRRLLIAWVWFVLPLVVLSIPAGKSLHFVLPLVPAAGVLTAQLWSYHVSLAGEGIPDPGINMLRLPHWVLLLAGSIAYPAYIVLQPALVERGWLGQVELPGIGWPIAALTGGLLLVIATVGAWLHWRWKPAQALRATFVWMLIALCLGHYSYARSYHSVQPMRGAAEQIAAVAAEQPLYQLAREPGYSGRELALTTLLHLGRPVPAIGYEAALLRTTRGGVVIGRRGDARLALLTDAGFARVLTVGDLVVLRHGGASGGQP